MYQFFIYHLSTLNILIFKTTQDHKSSSQLEHANSEHFLSH